jgi:hypothetical protein
VVTFSGKHFKKGGTADGGEQKNKAQEKRSTAAPAKEEIDPQGYAQNHAQGYAQAKEAREVRAHVESRATPGEDEPLVQRAEGYADSRAPLTRQDCGGR